MKGIWAGSSVLWLGLSLGGAQAQDGALRSAVSLGRPTPVAPAANRPFEALPSSAIRPASFLLPPEVVPPVIVRAKGPDLGPSTIPPLPLPSGQGQEKGPPLTEILNPGQRSDKPIATTPNGLMGEPGLNAGPLEGGVFAADPWCGAAGCCGEGVCAPSCGLEGRGDPSHCFWGRAEFLLWNISNSHVPPLLTTSSPTALGVLGQGDTAVLYGGTLDHEEFSGGRFTAGWWFDPCQHCGLEASYFFLGKRSIGYDIASGGAPLLARPFFNDNPAVNAEDSELIANPAIASLPGLIPLAGSMHIRQSTELWGTDASAVWNLRQGCWGRLDLLAGFRYLQLKEELDITENLMVPFTSSTVPGESILVHDHFATRNQFYGGQVGLRADLNWRRWDLEVTSKFAMGTTHQQVDINGVTVLTPPGGPPSVFTGGLLALPTNIGQFSRDHFTVVPEVGLNIGYKINDHWRVYTGYSFIYWSSVVRPGDQIDRVVNSSQIPPRMGPFVGPPHPAFGFRDTDFWAHGVNFGLEFKY
jgi:hypothetical protein